MTPPMSLEKFKKYMGYIKSDFQYIENVSDAIKSDFLFENLHGSYVCLDIISDMFHDGERDNIGFFVFELDWGEKSGVVTSEKDEPVYLNTIEDLYNLLVKKLKEEEKE